MYRFEIAHPVPDSPTNRYRRPPVPLGGRGSVTRVHGVLTRPCPAKSVDRKMLAPAGLLVVVK